MPESSQLRIKHLHQLHNHFYEPPALSPSEWACPPCLLTVKSLTFLIGHHPLIFFLLKEIYQLHFMFFLFSQLWQKALLACSDSSSSSGNISEAILAGSRIALRSRSRVPKVQGRAPPSYQPPLTIPLLPSLIPSLLTLSHLKTNTIFLSQFPRTIYTLFFHIISSLHPFSSNFLSPRKSSGLKMSLSQTCRVRRGGRRFCVFVKL